MAAAIGQVRPGYPRDGPTGGHGPDPLGGGTNGQTGRVWLTGGCELLRAIRVNWIRRWRPSLIRTRELKPEQGKFRDSDFTHPELCIIAHRSRQEHAGRSSVGTHGHGRHSGNARTTARWHGTGRSRGITIKAKAVTLRTEFQGELYELNLIDTPGHVDFHYEVSRSLTCCEGALLLVDAFQGVEAQTMANAYAAMEHNLKIIPVINKIDLTYARVNEVVDEMSQSLGTNPDEVIKCSAKAGIGIDELIEAIITRVPSPTGDPSGPLQAMVFDSHYDDFRGAITYVRLMSGSVSKGQRIQLARAKATYEAIEIGQFVPKRRPIHTLRAGQVGYLICNIKSLQDVHIGDTVVDTGPQAAPPLEGYQEPKRMVYCGLYPSEGQDFSELRDALEKLSINDPSFEFAPETSDALGFGFRCGFLGLLHMEIIQQRLENECDVDLVQTAPNVTYLIKTKRGEEIEVHKPQDVPDSGDIEEFHQPIVRVNFVVPTEFIGQVMKLSQDRRGVQRGTEYLSSTRL